MSDTGIVYGEFGIDTFKREICARLGEEFWISLTDGIDLPDIATERECGCSRMYSFMRRLEAMADAPAVKEILYKVRHGLRIAQSEWARAEFLEIGDIDEFLKVRREKDIENFERLCAEKKDFYGQEIDEEALEFIKANPSMTAPVREGNKLYIMAFPYNIIEHLHATDEKMKRYHACHCPFAKESILADKTVSATMCNCSLGHVMNFVEAFLDRPLEGRVLSSALNGDTACRYEVTIPEDIMDKYVRHTSD